LRAAYGARVDWEPAPALDARAAALVAALLLARVDGKSPAPYITDPADKALIRNAAKGLLVTRDLDLASLGVRWREAIAT
jgi:hypothetical protein